MNEGMLPVGTVIKTKKEKLLIIIGHPNKYISSKLASYIDFDYEVTSYPFDCMNLDNDISKIYKKYDWFSFGKSHINASEIKEVMFMGYQGE